MTKHFELRDYENVFLYLKSLKKEKVQLIVSTHWATQGYWIEPLGTTVTSEEDFLYRGKEILGLEKRVRKEIKEAKIENRNPKFIL
jgi:hypothetical protein